MTYYEILGVSKSASQEEIKSAYKKQVKKYHPDIYPGDNTFAEKKIKQINEAYEVLSDINKKSDYDLSITPVTDTQNYNYTPPKYSSNYTTSSHTNYTNKYSSEYNNVDKREIIYDELAKKLGANILVVLVIFILYLVIFIATLLQFKSYKNKHSFDNSTTNTFITNNNYDNKKLDINDYIKDDELLEIYNNYYIDTFDTFEEFKKALSTYIENYYGF